MITFLIGESNLNHFHNIATINNFFSSNSAHNLCLSRMTNHLRAFDYIVLFV